MGKQEQDDRFRIHFGAGYPLAGTGKQADHFPCIDAAPSGVRGSAMIFCALQKKGLGFLAPSFCQ